MSAPVLVAEIGGNHLGNLTRALALIDRAWSAGADAIKFQCFRADQMVNPDLVVHGGPWDGRRAIDLYRQTETPRAWFPQLFERVRSYGILPFASVFHPDDVDFLQGLDCPMYKIASFELTDLELIRYAASKGRPLVMSTGMASPDEIDCASFASRPLPLDKVTLLHCVSGYPSKPEEANLATLAWLRENMQCKVGLSDHTLGIGVAVAAAALGAEMIEKHLIMDRGDGGLDAEFSMEPDEFKHMAIECRRAAAAIGKATFGPRKTEQPHLALRRPPGGKRGDRNA